MKDIMKTSGSIKGKTKIELFNKNGELDYTHEESNIFSDFWTRYANLMLWGTDQTSVSHLKGYMYFYNTDKTAEELISRQINNEIDIVGYANIYSSISLTSCSGKLGARIDKLARNFNPNLVTRKNLITYVCDFPAGVATGNFNAISLCCNSTDIYSSLSTDYTVNLFKDDTFTATFKKSGTGFRSLKKDGLLYCVLNYTTKNNHLYVFDENYELKRTITQPVANTNYNILDLEPTNSEVIYVQVATTKDVYKLNLTDDTFEKVATWDKTIYNAFMGLKDGQDIIILKSDGINCYQYIHETYEIGEQLNSATDTTILNVKSQKRKDGDYVFIVSRFKAVDIYTSTEDFLSLNSSQCVSQAASSNYYLSIVDWYYDDNTGFVRVFAKQAATVSTITIVDFLPNKYTVNKLIETVTKAEDHYLRLTYTLEVDM